MKRKQVSLLLAAAMLSITVIGCSSQSSSTASTGTATAAESTSTETSEETVSSDSTAAAESLEEPDWEEMAKITLGDTITIDGTGAESDGQVLTITQGGSYEITGTLTDGMICVETDEAVKLILNGVDITSSTGPAIYGADSESIWIELAEGTENTLTDAEEYTGIFAETEDADTDSTSEDTSASGAIFSNDDLIFTGTGTLTVTGNYKHAITSDDSIYFEGGTYILSAVKDGAHANDFLVVDGGSITVTSCEEGLESKDTLIVNGGTIEVTGTDDGLNAATLLQVNGGQIFVDTSMGDGLDSNGTMEINGGVTVLLGAASPEGGADCDANGFTITGGILIATGGVNSAPTESTCTQASVLLGQASAGDTIAIKNSAGETVFTFSVTKSYENLLLSGDFLTEGETYTVYTGGTITGEETYHGYYADAEYEGGTESVTFEVSQMVVSAGGTAGMQGGGQGGHGNGGQMPENGEMPEGAEMPQGGQMPENGEMPEGGERPENGQRPGSGTMPDNGQQQEENQESESDDAV